MSVLGLNRKKRLLSLFFVSIFLSIAVKPLSAAPVDGFEEGIYRFLVRQRDYRSGILDSFINSDDITLEGQASTYDMALAGLGFLKLKDYYSARNILVFFQERWDGKGFCNFYDTKTGKCGLEYTVHLGPNMWIAILALQYTTETADEEFYPLAKKMALWAAGLNHKQGGLTMGPFKDWAGDWPNVLSAENNLVAYTVFRALCHTEKDKEIKLLLEKEMEGIREFIDTVILSRDEQGNLKSVSAGYNPTEGRSAVSACDVVTSLLLIFNPEELRKFFSIDEDALIDFAKKQFLVCEDGIQGFDFTDEHSSLEIKRPRMVSLEWTMQMACALWRLSDFYTGLSGARENREKASMYISESNFFTKEVDKKIVGFEDMYFYPYATKGSLQVFPFAFWWKTPQGNIESCGAMSSTMWRLFRNKEFNPLE